MLWLVVAAAVIAVVLGIAAVVDGRPSPIVIQLIGSSVVIFLACVLAFLCCLVLDKNILASLMWIGIATNWLSVLLWLFFIWFGEDMLASDGAWNYLRVVGVVNTVAVWSTYIGLMYWLPIRQGPLSILRTVTLALASLFAVLLIFIYVADIDNFDREWRQLFGKAVWIFCFLSIGLTVVTVVLTFVMRAKEKNTHDSMSERFEVEVICPRCDTTNKLKKGLGKCSKCSLRIRIEIEEPRCSCGYTIYRLEADRCPECGKSIAAEDRWLPSAAASGQTAGA